MPALWASLVYWAAAANGMTGAFSPPQGLHLPRHPGEHSGCRVYAAPNTVACGAPLVK